MTAATTLRREGFNATLTMVGDERRSPYDRPPLSKQVLRGDWEPLKAALRPDADLQRLNVKLELGYRVTGPAPVPRAVTIQIHGWCPPDAHIEVVDSDLKSRKFVALYYAGGRVFGTPGSNSPRSALRYRGRSTEHTAA